MERDYAHEGDKSQVEYDDELYFDMDFHDVTIPLEEDNNTHSCEQFEFSISARNNEPYHHIPEPIPADDLFYKGQLLPLDLTRRLEMVRNLSMSKESQVDKHVSAANVISFPNRHGGFYCSRPFSSCFRDSNQTSAISKVGELGYAKLNKIQQSQTVVESSSKFRVSLLELTMSSEVGMDDPHSTRCSPSIKNPNRSELKSKSMKILIRFFAKNYGTESHTNPYHLSRSTSAKRVFHKFLSMMKYTISYAISRDHDHQLEVQDTCEWPSIAGGLMNEAKNSFSNMLKKSFKHLQCIGGWQHSKDSSPLYDEVVSKSRVYDLPSGVQEAIAYCKQSNGINDTKRSMNLNRQ